MDELLPAIGHRLRAARAFLGLSQEDVAARAQLNTSYLSQIERGRKAPSLAVLVRLSRAVGLSLTELFADQEATTSTIGDREVAALLRSVPEDRRGEVLDIIRAVVNISVS